MELFHLKQFVAIAQCGSMSKAADKLYITQSALSQNMKKLERELGCTLFDRSRLPMRLTPYGEVLLSYSERVVRNLERAREDIEDLKRVDEATVRVGCSQVILALLVMPMVARENPSMYYTASICDEEGIVAGLLERKIDVALLPDRPKPAGFEKVRLGEEQAFLSVPKKSPLGALRSLSMADCAGMEIVVPKDIQGASAWYREMINAAGEGAVKAVEFPPDEYLACLDKPNMVHFRTSLMSSSISAEAFRANIPIEDSCARRAMAAFYPRDEAGRLREVLKLLESCLDASQNGLAPASYLMYPTSLSNLNFEYR